MKKSLRYFYMNTAEILDKIFFIYKKTFLYQLLRILLTGAVSMIIGVILVIVLTFIVSVAGVALLANNPNPTFGVVAAVLILTLFLIVVYAFVAAINTGSNLSICRQAFYEKKPNFNLTVKETLKAAPKIFSVYLSLVLVYIPVILIASLIIFAAFSPYGYGFSFYDFMDMDPVPLIVTVLAIGLFLLTCAIIINTMTCCAVGCAVYEGLSFFSAIKKSMLLTKGRRVKIALVLLLWYVISYVVSSSVSSVSALISVFTSVFDYSLSSMMFFMPLAIILEYAAMIITSLIMAPFNGIILSVIYFNQKIKKEGLDIIIELETEGVVQ